MVAAGAFVPLTKVVLMYWEYRLHLPLAPWFETTALIVALAIACVIACRGAPSSQAKLLLSTVAIAWAAFACVAVSFVPGCVWAPACL